MADLIKIEFRHGYSNCEDCGSYAWSNLIIFQNNERILTKVGDDHFGPRPLEKESVEFLSEALSELGHTVYLEITEED